MNLQQCRERIERCFPQIRVQTLTPILEGWDSLVLEVNGDLMFRFARRPETAAQYEREIRLLPELARVLSFRVPAFAFVCSCEGEGGGWLVGYHKIEGVPVTGDLPRSRWADQMADHLARFLSELHRFPAQKAEESGIPVFTAAGWRNAYRDLYGQVRAQVSPLLEEPARCRLAGRWECFLGQDSHFQFGPTLIHGDLGGEHILWDPTRGALTGVIDWGDARVGDPALDFAGLLRDCGGDFAGKVLARYQGPDDTTLMARAGFYAAIVPVYEVLYGLALGDRVHVEQGVASLQRDFDRGEHV